MQSGNNPRQNAEQPGIGRNPFPQRLHEEKRIGNLHDRDIEIFRPGSIPVFPENIQGSGQVPFMDGDHDVPVIHGYSPGLRTSGPVD
jgi:hypothetical protein